MKFYLMEEAFFIMAKLLMNLVFFMPQDLEVEFTQFKANETKLNVGDQKNTWEDLFSPRIDVEKKVLTSLSDDDFEEIISAQIFAIKSYLEKVGIKKLPWPYQAVLTLH